MPDRSQELQRFAVAIVAKSQPMKPYDLLNRLKSEHGASHAEANRTMLTLIRDGGLKRTFLGELVLPGASGGKVDPMQVGIYVVFMGGILAFMAFVFSRLLTGG
jgi:hypothetical protein